MKKIFIIAMVILIAIQTNIGVVAANDGSADNKPDATQDAKAALTPFVKDGKWGYMDVKGNVIVKPQYDYAESFSDGLGRVRLKGKSGYIDGTGKISIPIKYDGATSFRNGNAVVMQHNEVTDEYTSYWIKPNGKYFLKLIDDGSEYELITYEPFCGGLARIVMDGDEPSYGYIDKKGSTVIIPDYWDAEPFSEGLALVCKSIESKYEFINEKGEVAIAHTQNFNWVGSFSEGLAPVWVAKNKCGGFADKNGKIKIPTIYQNVRSFSDGLAAVEQNGLWGFIDKNNKFVIKPQYERVGDCINGLIMVRNKGEGQSVGEFLYYIDKNNNIIKPKI